jgi:hypothetical protein
MSKAGTSDLPSGPNGTEKPKKKKPRWKAEAIKLRAELEEAQEKNEVLRERLSRVKLELDALAAAGLDERHRVKLRRLENLAARIVNMQVCKSCQESKNAILEDLEFIK